MKRNKKVLIIMATVILCLFNGLILSGSLEKTSSSEEEKVLIKITVLNENVTDKVEGYIKRKGEPTELYIYEAVEDPTLKHVIKFKKIDTVSLQKKDCLTFMGEKYINRSNNMLCVGYATTNFIDGNSCIMINQSLNEAELEVKYWDCNIALN